MRPGELMLDNDILREPSRPTALRKGDPERARVAPVDLRYNPGCARTRVVTSHGPAGSAAVSRSSAQTYV